MPLFPVGRCSWLGVAGFGWVVLLCLFGGHVFGALWVGGWASFCVVGGFGGCGLFSRPPLPPPLFFWGGGGGLAVPPFAFPRLALALWLVCGVVGPSPLLVPVSEAEKKRRRNEAANAVTPLSVVDLVLPLKIPRRRYYCARFACDIAHTSAHSTRFVDFCARYVLMLRALFYSGTKI